MFRVDCVRCFLSNDCVNTAASPWLTLELIGDFENSKSEIGATCTVWIEGSAFSNIKFSIIVVAGDFLIGSKFQGI